MPRIKSVFFGTSINPTPYSSSSRTPSCAINGSNTVVEVHKDAERNLFWRIGNVDRVNLTWKPLPTTGYSSFHPGNNPSVALTDGNVAVVMNDISGRLQYSVGTVRNDVLGFLYTGREFPGQLPVSVNPSVALTGGGIVLEVHQSGSGIFWRRGRLGGADGETLDWSNQQQLYATGIQPSVAVNNVGMAVAVFQVSKTSGESDLYYSIGTFDATKKAVDAAVTWTAPAPYDIGSAPSVTLTDDGYVFEVHERGTEADSHDIHQRIGRISANAIEWQDVLTVGNQSMRIADGNQPQVCSNGKVAVLVFGQSVARRIQVAGRASLIFDRANWMGDHATQLSTKTLRQLALPASHDSGAFADNAARTQDLPISGQLAYGVRYFDIRPEYTGGAADSPGDISKFFTYHDIARIFGKDYVQGVAITDVIAQVRAFVQEHEELVILKLSHFYQFNQTLFDTMIAAFIDETTGLGPYLYFLVGGLDRPRDTPRRLADHRMDEIVRRPDHGTVLLLVDVDTNASNADYVTDEHRRAGAYRYRDWYAADPGRGDFTVFDVFSDTPDFSKMVDELDPDPNHSELPGSSTRVPQGQLPKFDWFDGKCQGTNQRSEVQCDLFLLSWTITPNFPASEGTAFAVSGTPNGRLVDYLFRPQYQGLNPKGLTMNLLYTDAVELSRSVDLAMVRNDLV
jgi:hypothetical protein